MYTEPLGRAGWDFLYLTGCALNKIPPDRTRVEEMNLEAVHALAQDQNMSALLGHALSAGYGGALPETPLCSAWRQEICQAVRRDVLLELEYREVTAFLERAGIWYLPVKGIVLREFFPEAYLREMADVDLLYDPAGQEQVRDWFVRRGYQVLRYRQGEEDSYLRAPVYHFELHTALFLPPKDPRKCAFSRDIPNRMRPVPGTAYARRLREEDCYLYMTAHMDKHRTSRGTGVRCLADCYAFLRETGQALDWAYLRRETERLGISEIEEQVRTLSFRLFQDPEHVRPETLSEGERALLTDLFCSGAYGTLDHMVARGLGTPQEQSGPARFQARLRYLGRRIYPGREAFLQWHPFVRDHRWLLPVGVVWRLLRGVCTHLRQICTEVQSLCRRRF